MTKPNTFSSTKLSLAGKFWAEAADLIDRQLSPLGLHAMQVLEPKTGEAVLDVGCGSGQSLLQLADKVGPGGRVTGVDISAPLLEVARRRTEGFAQVDLFECDATILALPDKIFDCVFSRFGVMAFPDPITAFTNLRRLIKPSGRMAFVCWRSLQENELDYLPLQAAGLQTLHDATPFSFSDPDCIRATLLKAGFRQVTVQPYDEMISCGGLERFPD